MDDRRPRRNWARLAAGIAAAALFAGGGVVLGTHLTSGASPASSAARVSMRLASEHVTAGATQSHRQHMRRTALRRLALRRAVLRRLMRLGGEHGQITFKTKKGTKTVAFMRGIIQRASSGSFAVKDADGSALTWNLVTKTVVIRARERVAAAVLATGQRVFVVGPVVGGTDEARLIIIRG